MSIFMLDGAFPIELLHGPYMPPLLYHCIHHTIHISRARSRLLTHSPLHFLRILILFSALCDAHCAAALLGLMFVLLNICWSMLFFDGYQTHNTPMIALVVITHFAASLTVSDVGSRVVCTYVGWCFVSILLYQCSAKHRGLSCLSCCLRGSVGVLPSHFTLQTMVNTLDGEATGFPFCSVSLVAVAFITVLVIGAAALSVYETYKRPRVSLVTSWKYADFQIIQLCRCSE